jgi:hypothetical protein
MKIMAAILTAILLMSAPARADNPPPCDYTDSACLVRSALTYKYRADALQTENDLLRKENDALRQSPSPTGKTIILCTGVLIVFFGGIFAMGKIAR